MTQHTRCVFADQRKRNSSTRAACLLLPALCLNACGDPLIPRELVQGSRVLGARVELDGNAEAAWVAPGRTASVRWLLVSPSGPPVLGWAFSLCVAAPVSRDLPVCAAPSFAQFTSSEPTAVEPRIEFTMPDETTLDGAGQITANGALCSSGRPIVARGGVEPTTVRCPESNERPLLATMGIFVSRGESTNTNPALRSVEIRIDDVRWSNWPEPAAAPSGCAALGESLPVVRTGSSPHTLSFALPAALAEALPTVSARSADVETIQLSHFVTAGDLERAFSAVDLGKPTPQVSVTWTAPRDVPSDGQLVRFYFVLRDGRGGVDWSTHAVCVTP
jgi:hypothetical protein